MTDNEKAATFIGWTPERVCSGLYYGERRGHQFKLIPCEHGQANAHVVDNTVAPSPLIHWKNGPAPDMSRPENYMRALEVLPYNWEFSRNHAEGHNCNIYVADEVVFGSYPLDTLAALYDKEHNND